MTKRREKEVISFNRSSEFFFKVGMKHADQKEYNVAEKYLSRAVEMEPFNADFQYNLACVFAEKKDVKKSNKILLGILREIDPTLTECYFGIACNYFDLGNFKKAREYFERYVYSDPNGNYVDEAYDILYYLQIYSNVGISPKKNHAISSLASEGKRLIGEGRYVEARSKLEKTILIDPSVTSPRNDLSLVYLFLDDIDKAISLAKSVLKLEPKNVHALCNLTLFYAYKNYFDLYNEQLKILDELLINSKSEFSKLLNTFIVLKENIYIVTSLIKYLREEREPAYFHLLAVGLYNIKRYEYSVEVLDAMEELYPHYNLLVKYNRRIVTETKEGLRQHVDLEYLNKLPEKKEEPIKDKFNSFMHMGIEEFKEAWVSDNELRDIVFYMLLEGNKELKIKVICKLATIKSSEIIEVLKIILEDEDLDGVIKKTIIEVLGLKGYNSKNKKGLREKAQKNKNDIKIRTIEWKNEWESILECALQNKELVYKGSYKKELKDIWMNLVNKVYPENMPVVKKREVWAATLEYLYRNLHLIKVSKRKLAQKYNISAASITNKLKEFES